jgi:hypothetical protein
MVQLRKSRKSFRKIRGRKTRQRKNEKRKSRKTRSTRKTGGHGEEKIADKIKELASKIGELVKLDTLYTPEKKKKKITEIQQIFNWLTGDKSGIRCTFNRITSSYGTCHRKKMIYYYIAIHLVMCFIYAKPYYLDDDKTIKEKLINKFEKHKGKQEEDNIVFAGDDPLNIWKEKGEQNFISGIVKTLYDSILEENERAVDDYRVSEGDYYGEVITKIILTEVEIDDITNFVGKGNSIFEKWIVQIKNLKKRKEERNKNYGYPPPKIRGFQIKNKLATWAEDNGIIGFVPS